MDAEAERRTHPLRRRWWPRNSHNPSHIDDTLRSMGGEAKRKREAKREREEEKEEGEKMDRNVGMREG